MIFDCFPFYNELDVLEMRLTLLDDVVDLFVLSEAPFDYRGQPKPLYYAENAARFARWHHKLAHYVVPVGASTNPWENEWNQRSLLTNALRFGAPDDLVLYGDVDEIPHPDNVACRPPPGGILGHRQRLTIGYFNRVIMEGWVGTRTIRLGDVAARGTLAEVRSGPSEQLPGFVDGGWHLSSLGGTAVAANKAHTNSHPELDVRYYTDERRLDVELSSDYDAIWTSPDGDDAPALFREPRWAHYVWPKPRYDAVTGKLLTHVHGCFAYVPAGARRVVALTGEAAVWNAVGAERFGTAFAGAFASVDELPATAAGDWIVVDGFERLSDVHLTELVGRRLRIVAFARNARSHDAVASVMQGEPFPAGRTWGVAEMKAAVAAAGCTLERCDPVSIRTIWVPVDMLPEHGRFERSCLPFHLLATTKAEAIAFNAHAFVLEFAAAGLDASERPS